MLQTRNVLVIFFSSQNFYCIISAAGVLSFFCSESRPLCNEAALLVLGTARVDEVGSVSSIRRDGRPSHIPKLYYV